MANTVIQLKWSDISSTPTSLNVGEAAYSNTSNKLFIGDTTGNVLTIGGKYFTDQQGLIFTKTNVAFDTANSAASYANAAFATANSGTGAASAGQYANAAFLQANTPSYTANSAASYANSGFSKANSAYDNAATAQGTADTALTAAGTAQSSADAASSYANSAFITANNNSGVNLTQNNNISSAASYANSGFALANSAFTRANNSINANTGGTITADLVITGNLTVQGNTTYVDTRTITTGDSLIHLANNNTAGDTVDIGFYGTYNASGQKYTGLVRQAGADYFLFKGLTSDPTANVLAAGSLTIANTGTLTANLTTSVITNFTGTDLKIGPTGKETTIVSSTGVIQPYSAFVGGNYSGNQIDVSSVGFGTQIKGLYEGVDIRVSADGSGANVSQFKPDGTVTLFGSVTAAGVNLNSLVNTAYTQANTAATNATSAGVYANAAFATANTGASAGSSANAAFATANSAASYANSAFATANNNSGVNLTQNTNISSAASYANAAFLTANTDVTNISITAADYGSASSVAAFRIEANGRISSANSTAIAIAASAITSGTLGVTRGGTGANTFTNNGVLLGQGTSAFSTASSSTEGHVLTINASGVPTFSHLQGGTF
jgi:hypothetical protein